MLGAVAQDHGLARAGHAVDDAVAVAQAAGQLLLLHVHHAHDVRVSSASPSCRRTAFPARRHAHLGNMIQRTRSSCGRLITPRIMEGNMSHRRL